MRDLQSSANPKLLADGWVVRIDAFRSGEDNLRAAIDSQEQRARIGILRLVLWLKTAFLPGASAKCRSRGWSCIRHIPSRDCVAKALCPRGPGTRRRRCRRAPRPV